MENAQEFAKLIQKAQKKLERYNKILDKSTKSAFAYQQRMEVLILLGKVQEGFDDLDKALALNPEDQDLINHPLNPKNLNPVAPVNLEYAILFFNIANHFYRAKELVQALRYINLALARETGMPNFYLLKGFILFEDKNTDNQAALFIAEQILKQKPDYPLARYLRGVVVAEEYPLSFEFKLGEQKVGGAIIEVPQYENTEAITQAIADISYALENIEGNLEIKIVGEYKKIQLLILLNEIDQAYELINQNIANYDNNAYTYYMRAIIHYKKGNILASNEDFQKFVQLLDNEELKAELQQILNDPILEDSSLLNEAQQYLGKADNENGSRGSILDDFNFNPN